MRFGWLTLGHAHSADEDPGAIQDQLTLLDNPCDGRLDVGVGHGTNYNEYEFAGYGLRSEDSRERMEETRSRRAHPAASAR